MATVSINDFKAKLSGGGVRPTLFKVELFFPQAAVDAVGDLAELGTFLIKSTSLPASNVGKIDIPFRGRMLKVSGDRSFDDWSCQVIADRDFKIRNALEKWSEVISHHSEIIGESEYDGYFSRANVTQLDRDGEPIRVYVMEGIWPVSLDPIDVSFDAIDTIEEFGCTFAVQYWHAAAGGSPPSSGGGYTSDVRTVIS